MSFNHYSGAFDVMHWLVEKSPLWILQPIVIIDGLYEELTTDPHCITNLMQMIHLKIWVLGKTGESVFPPGSTISNLIKIVLVMMSVPIMNVYSYVEDCCFLMTWYWHEESNQCSEELVNAEIQIKTNCVWSFLCNDLF